MDFTPILRCDDLDTWRTADDATDFEVANTAVHTPDDDMTKIQRNAKIWRTAGHEIGVQVLQKWSTEPKNITSLAGYHGFNEKCVANFVDTVVPDIIPAGLKLLHSKFRVEVAKALFQEYSVESGSLPDSMDALYINSRTRVDALPEGSSLQLLIGPIELMNMYTHKSALKRFVDQTIQSIKVPIFLPITRGVISSSDAEDNIIDPAATILIQAAQILLFAPTKWHKDIKYTRLTDDLEDLHRAVILVYLAIYRRVQNGTAGLKTQRAPQPRGTFSGYYDVERQIPDDTAGKEGASQLAVARFIRHPLPVLQTGLIQPSPTTASSESRSTRAAAPDIPFTPCEKIDYPPNLDKWLEIRERFDWDDPDQVFARVSEHITSFNALVGDQHLIEFVERGSASTVIQEFLALHPEDEKGLNDALLRSYALETVFNGHPPPEDTDINAVCSRFGIKPYPSLELYPDQGFQPLKPHQVAGVIFQKLDTIGHILLSNEMGLGKTKVFISMIECRARELEAKFKILHDDNNRDIFFPTLVVNPPSIIHQTHAEMKANFPGLKVLMYYASKSQSRKFDSATILEKNEFLQVLRKLSNSDPQTARIVIMTTYNTLHCREVSRTERRFIFLERKEKGPTAKRPKTMTPPPIDSTEVDDALRADCNGDSSDSDSDYYTPAEMLAFQARRPETTPKLRKYHKGDLELKNKRLHFLKGHERALPDGYLVEYNLVRPALGDVKWGFLIVDEAHTARRVDGVTGTPLMGSLHDIISPLSLIWSKLDIETPPNGDIGIGYTQGLWEENYDPNINNTWPNGKETKGIFTEKFLKSCPSEGWTQMQEFYKRTGVKIWQINPTLVERAGRQAEWSSAFGQKVMSVVLGMVSLHRTQRSRLILPDGQVCFPAADLMPMTIITEELSYDPARRPLVQEHGRNIAARIFVAGPSNTTQNFTPSQNVPPSGAQEGSLNFGAYRQGVLVAYDWRNSHILYSNVEEIFGGEPDAIANTLRLLRDSGGLTDTQAKRLQQRTAKHSMPTVGVNHVQKLLSFDNNQGLDYFFTRTCLDPDVLPLTDRAAWIYWLTATSPVLARTIELCHRYVHERKERVLIYVDTPWIQQMMYSALLMAGFKSLTVRSSDKPSAKIEAVQKFSDPRSDAQVFIANINIMSTGLNLHHACCFGILATFHFNAKTIQQVHGRLHRLGQKKVVVWHNLKVKDSFHDYQERMLLTKWSRQLSAESNLPRWMTGTLREIVLFELIRSYFHQPFNRYSWVILADRDGKAMAYYSEEAIKLGYACSALAKLSLNTEKGAYWIENDDYIATALLELVASVELKQTEPWLTMDESQLRVAMELEKFIHGVKNGESLREKAKFFSQRVKERQQTTNADFTLEESSDNTEEVVEDEDATADAPLSNQGDGE
ncbi:hypothetical protein TrVGV298_009592 [Trichoderma virens]|nr:hypothetical protein TrVGV298_009592 [Trichoderma virens]